MYKFDEINYYEDDLNIKNILKEINLQEIDESLNICDLTNIVNKHDIWQKNLPRIHPHYAVKCNDNPYIVKTLAELGTSFDCASKNEIKQVLDFGVNPEHIIFANPCKPLSHIEFAKEKNVQTGTVDNEFEIYKLYKHYPESKLVVRFRCEAKNAQCPLGNKFGCDAENDATALMLLAKSLDLNVCGTSFHVGSGCNEFAAYNRAIMTAKNIFNFGEMLGFNMNLLDIGGGFPGSDDTKFLTISNIINVALDRYFSSQKIKVIAEPGRFYVAAAYTLICKIHAKREVRNAGKLDTKMYYINDGVYGSFNCILYDHHEVTATHMLNDSEGGLPTFKTLLWGPTCDALDKISDNLYLPNLNCGDLLAFPNMGAYTVPIASPFNGFMTPKTLYFMKKKPT
ncbi:ornithine decarboxylase 1-like [Teleopsis dalmanni]|uniref:ornithine decarboxylase 1-like n=1 Tax=Teleopsis dalmanni TaxID=139649 RepID=UPI0018CDD527|nr:ornithine decarboxylase 1-like [Teleopsis dalmanni]